MISPSAVSSFPAVAGDIEELGGGHRERKGEAKGPCSSLRTGALVSLVYSERIPKRLSCKLRKIVYAKGPAAQFLSRFFPKRVVPFPERFTYFFGGCQAGETN